MTPQKSKPLAIDLGLKRIGLAILAHNIAIPITPVLRKNRNQAADEIKQIIKDNHIDTLVFGLPYGESKEEMKRRCEHFLKLLEFEGDHAFIDEDFSSHEAGELTQGVFRDKKSGRLDSVAAKIILERWLTSFPDY